MIVPGSDILDIALSVIEPQQAQLLRNIGRVLNSSGLYIPQYSAPESVSGSIQAVKRNKYEALGLDFQKSYVMVYFTTQVQDLKRGTGGDLMVWQGRRWQFVSETDWHPQDHWSGILAIDIGAYVPVTTGYGALNIRGVRIDGSDASEELPS